MLVNGHLRRVAAASLLSCSPRVLTARLQWIRTRVQEDRTVSYDLHAAFSKDPNNVKTEDAWDDYTKIQQAAIRAGKRPPKKKKPKFDAVGQLVGIRAINYDIPKRIRRRLIDEGLEMDPHFYISRYGLNKEVVKRIRSAFRLHEVVRLEVGSPWTDNPAKFAERLEYRTGAIVLDRAGSRFLLYRGFTHADLARKGLGNLDCFTVGQDYETRYTQSMEGSEGNGRGWQRRSPIERTAPERHTLGGARRNLSHTPWYQQTPPESPARQVASLLASVWIPSACVSSKGISREDEAVDADPALSLGDDGWYSMESDEETEVGEHVENKGSFIELDEEEETIVSSERDEEEEERVRNLMARIRYNAARVNLKAVRRRRALGNDHGRRIPL